MQKSASGPEAADAAAPRSRGRPRAFDRDAALAQATRLFWTKGYEATSIADLTQAMGIGAPSLYAAFGSKEALYVEALRYYGENYDALVWSGFRTAPTAHEAIACLLRDSAAALTGSLGDNPLGCMVTLAMVSGEDQPQLCDLMRTSRSETLRRLEARLALAVAENEVSATTDLHALARFVQTVQSGMSILARDGATRVELEAVAQVALAGWDAQAAAAMRAPPT